LILEEADFGATACRANDALGPSAHSDVVQTVLWNREIKDRFLKSLRPVGFHISMVAQRLD